MRNISDVKELLATTHAAHTLELNADSTEFCPIQGYEDILAVGTYQLQEELQERIGQLLIYKLRWQSGQPGATAQEGDNLQEASKNVSTCGSANSLILKPVPQLCHTTRVPGIFDLKWQPVIGSTGFGAVPVLGGALADGSLRLYALQQDEQASGSLSTSISMEQTAQCTAVSEGMCLSLDWERLAVAGTSTGCDGSSSSSASRNAFGASSVRRVAVSGSSGHVAIAQAAEAQLCVVTEWQPHTLEVWCTAFHPHMPNIVLSGSDDATLKVHDTSIAQGTALTLFSDRRTHGSGVTTLSPHPRLPYLLASGSYDESVRLWDIRQPSKPLLQAQASTGGGVWRLRWCPHDDSLLLAACMYNGFAVLHTSGTLSPDEDIPAASGRCTATASPSSSAAASTASASAAAAGGCGSAYEPLSIALAGAYMRHGSIAYGADWWYGHQHASMSAASWRGAHAAAENDAGPEPVCAADAPAAASSGGSHDVFTRASQHEDARQCSTDGAGDIPDRESCRHLAATCSFYDKLLHVWSWQG